MGRDLELLPILLLVILVVGVAFAIGMPMLLSAIRGMNSGRQGKKEIKAQQQLAILAPAALRGDALLPIIVDQGTKLKEASAILTRINRGDIDVMIPTELSEQIKAWQTKYEEEK